MRIFGGVLPFIGFRLIDVDRDGNPCGCIVEEHWKADAFAVEWFGSGAILFIGKVHPNV